VTNQGKLKREMALNNAKRAFSRAYSRVALAIGDDIYLMELVNKAIYAHSRMEICKENFEAPKGEL